MIEFDALKAALERDPFVPFTISLVRGRTYAIDSPKLALLTRTVLLFGTSVADDGVAENFVECPVSQIFKLK